MKELETQVATTKIENEDEVASYFQLREQLSNLSKEFHSWLVRPQYLIPFVQAGRLVSVKYHDKDFGWAVVVSFKKNAPKVKKTQCVF